MTDKRSKKQLNIEIAAREKATGGQFNGLGFETTKQYISWFDDYEYFTEVGIEERQHKTTFKIPNAKAGPKEIIVTDPYISSLLSAALDSLVRMKAGEKI